MDKIKEVGKDVICVVGVFAAVALFGLIADKVFKSEEKAEEARKLGYDV
jgi:SRSO17 transposase